MEVPLTLKVTIFGPVHAGKSTLAGYLRWLGVRAEAERDIARAHRAGSAFDEAQALAYLVDRAKDERLRDPATSQTTSKRLHITSARIGGSSEIDVIDTLGGWRQHREQRLRGLYYGDVGIFAIEPIVDALSAARLGETPQARTEAFSALLTWVALRPDAPLIVAVTKGDLPTTTAARSSRRWRSSRRCWAIASGRSTSRSRSTCAGAAPVTSAQANRASPVVRRRRRCWTCLPGSRCPRSLGPTSP